MNQMPISQQQEKPINYEENDSSKIDELAGNIYQIIEGRYPE